jgi:large subunit ribosomal protein L24
MVTKQPRKQRLALYSAPLHSCHKLLSAPLSRELREKHKIRSLPIRKGDNVRILRGDFKKLEGDVTKVDTKHRFIQVKGVNVSKADGKEVSRMIRPSNVMLLKLVADKERTQIIDRRSKSG